MARALYLSIGSNAVDASRMVMKAINEVLTLEGAREIGRGRLYRTEPQGRLDQPWFVNTALALWLELEPLEALKRLKKIEAGLGRTPGERWGPREIDIDIIFYGDLVMTTDELTIPHPRAAQRRFALAPLLDIDPGLIHPGLGRPVAELLEALPEDGQVVQLIEP
ncbi:MAG: 2-amino-4-hydroxy-6-hydroxymethyldihydropteridine diphosphokinase [Nitrospinota bacterium]|nr:2-amino-4-hydroxy-6-hydroxymethyldihydropteridine diphosphokinase [Nitrospinota bacterium]